MLAIRFYGPLADSIGKTIALDLPEGCDTVGALRNHIASAFPQTATLIADKRTRCFIDDRSAQDGDRLAKDATAEFLPPVSGG